jgi:hypothetical protein
MVASLIVVLLAQADAGVEPGPPLSAEEREAKALEKLSEATEKLAAAAERLSPPPPVEEKAAEPPKYHWDFFTNAGMTWTAGNTQSISFVASAGGKRIGEKTIWQYKLFGGYGQAFSPAVPPNTVSVTNVLLYYAGGTGQFDYRFTNLISMFLGAGLDTDHVASVELRGYGDLGVGVLWLDLKQEKYQKLLLKTDFNVRVQPESRFQYYPTPEQIPDVLLVGPRAAVAFKYGLNAGTFFSEDLEVMPNVIGPTAGRVVLNSTSKLAVGLAAHIAVALGLTFKYDSQPAMGKVALDTLLTAGVEATY